jgi:hypothetical protein
LKKNGKASVDNTLEELASKCSATPGFLLYTGISPDLTSPQTRAPQLPQWANKRAN